MTLLETALFDLHLTCLIEWGVLYLFVRSGIWTTLGVSLSVNCFTNPLAHVAVWSLSMNYWLVEILVMLVEFPIYQQLLRTGLRKAGIISVTANATSLLVGGAIYGF